jgi:polar amino acid transport system ATP-binding protein
MADLRRFVKGYMCYFDQAVSEIRSGEQKGHWIFMVFPQMKELGYSAEAKAYGIEDRAEAEAFAANPELMDYLTGVSQAILDSGHTPEEIFGSPKRERTRAFINHLRQLPLIIKNEDFDFIGYTSQIESFGRSNMLSEKAVRNLVLVFEEAVMQGISARRDAFPISVTIELSENDEPPVMEAVYGGGRFDPASDGDELSARILKKMSADISFSYENGANRFRSTIKT